MAICDKAEKLKEIAEILRSERGCPWDKSLDERSMSEFFIEEVYELVEEIETLNYKGIKEELGDLLSLIFMLSQIINEKNIFSIEDVFKEIINKLLFRHPHVFGDKKAKDHYEALNYWNSQKLKEKKDRKSIMDGLPANLPALLYALKVQRKAEIVNFDWKSENIHLLFKKICEEVNELETVFNKFKDYQDLQNNEREFTSVEEELIEELGDILFSIVNLARKLKIDPEIALRNSTKKFITRFKKMEELVEKEGRNLIDLNNNQLEKLWEKVKKLK